MFLGRYLRDKISSLLMIIYEILANKNANQRALHSRDTARIIEVALNEYITDYRELLRL